VEIQELHDYMREQHYSAKALSTVRKGVREGSIERNELRKVRWESNGDFEQRSNMTRLAFLMLWEGLLLEDQDGSQDISEKPWQQSR
jgi:hypothetical protein